MAEMEQTKVQIESIVPPQEGESLTEWIEKQMNDGREFLLAHFDDGVVWGKRGANDKLITSHDFNAALSPPLRLTTLQQAFVFGENSEARLWRGEMGDWEARMIKEPEDTKFNDEKADGRYCFDEDQILWGTETPKTLPEVQQTIVQAGFTHVREARQQGMEHIVPVKVDPAQLAARKLKLRVRHFISHDAQTGEARIYLSRLVKVFVS